MPDDKTLNAGKVLGYMVQYMKDAYIKDIQKRMDKIQKTLNELRTGMANDIPQVPPEFPKMDAKRFKSIPEYRAQYFASLTKYTKYLESREQRLSSDKVVLFSLDATLAEAADLSGRVSDLLVRQYPQSKNKDNGSPEYIDHVMRVISHVIKMTNDWAASSGVIIRNRVEQSEHVNICKAQYKDVIKNNIFNDAENYFRGRIMEGSKNNDSRNEYRADVGEYDYRNFDMTTKDMYSNIKRPLKEVAELYARKEQERDNHRIDQHEHCKHVHSPTHSR